MFRFFREYGSFSANPMARSSLAEPFPTPNLCHLQVTVAKVEDGGDVFFFPAANRAFVVSLLCRK